MINSLCVGVEMRKSPTMMNWWEQRSGRGEMKLEEGFVKEGLGRQQR